MAYMKKQDRINIRCEEALKKGLEKRAKSEGMTFADFIRWILRKEIKTK